MLKGSNFKSELGSLLIFLGNWNRFEFLLFGRSKIIAYVLVAGELA